MSAGLLGACSPSPLPLTSPEDTTEPAVPYDGGVEASTPDAALPFPLTQLCVDEGDGSTPQTDDACRQCSIARCCQTRQLVLTPRFAPLVKCMQLCVADDEDCYRACFDASPALVPMYFLHVACVSNRCNGACSGLSSRCVACTDDHCARESLDMSTAEGFLAQACVGRCDSAACTSACWEKYPGAKRGLKRLTTCLERFCAGECQ